jgi:hypothetical protein
MHAACHVKRPCESAILIDYPCIGLSCIQTALLRLFLHEKCRICVFDVRQKFAPIRYFEGYGSVFVLCQERRQLALESVEMNFWVILMWCSRKSRIGAYIQST